MRYRRRQQNIKDFTGAQLIQHGGWLMYNRQRLLAPPPFEPEKIYDALLTGEQHKAIELLQRTMPSMLSMGAEVNAVFDRDVVVTTSTGHKHRAKYLEINLPANRVVPDTGLYTTSGPSHRFLVSALPRDIQDGLQEWARRWLILDAETCEVTARLGALFSVCNTVGQAVRVWPQVKSLLTQRAQTKLAEAKVKSPYPEAVLERSSDWDDEKNNYKLIGLKDAWKPEALQWYDDRLTEALCLPEVHTKEEAALSNWPLKVIFGPA